MKVELSDSMWFNPRILHPTDSHDRQNAVTVYHGLTMSRWHTDGLGAVFMAAKEMASLVQVLYIDCFVPPWIGTGNVRHGTIASKDFALKALLLNGKVGRYRNIEYYGEPQCVHFGPGGPGQFHVGRMIVKDALGLEEGATSDAQLPHTQTNPETLHACTS